MAPDAPEQGAGHHWGGATGVGSWPGTEPLEACRTVLDLLPDLPSCPSCRTAARSRPRRPEHRLLAGLPVDLQPSGWRLVSRPSQDGRRARDLLSRDLDALEEAADASGRSR
jgi:hypothetical protein